VKKVLKKLGTYETPSIFPSISFNQNFHGWHWQTLSSLDATFQLDDTSWWKLCWQWQFWQVVDWSGVKPIIFPSSWSSTDKVCVCHAYYRRSWLKPSASRCWSSVWNLVGQLTLDHVHGSLLKGFVSRTFVGAHAILVSDFAFTIGYGRCRRTLW
jgi:hypothetical protein